MLREWGEAYATPDEVVEPRMDRQRAPAPRLRTVFARVALEMADGLESRIGAIKPAGTDFDETDFYAYLDGLGDAGS